VWLLIEYFAFTGFIVILIILGLLSILGINKLTSDLKHMYRTGVVPEHDGARLLKLQYENRYRLEEYITGLSHEKLPEIKIVLDRNNHIMDSLGGHHLASDYFETEKKNLLKDFIQHHNRYEELEMQIVKLGVGQQHDVAVKLFSGPAYSEFKTAIETLDQLEDSELNQGGIQLQNTVVYANNLRVIELITIITALAIAIIIGTMVGRSVMEN